VPDPQPVRKLANRVALVTGAARRIGRSIALELARRGADVAVNYRSSRADAEVLAAEIGELGRRSRAIQADVSVRADVVRLIHETQATFGQLDILVNNAGMFQQVAFDALTDEQWNGIIATNLTSQFLCSQVAAPLLKRSGRGRIINLASLGGLLAWPRSTHYCVSKSGVIMLTRCLARALAPEITVNAIAPGTISFPGDAPELEADYIRRAPLGRTGKGSEIAGAVIFLAESDFITGQILAVDGGRSLT